MRASYLLDSERRLVIATSEGKCNVPVRKELIREVAADENAAGLNWLVDMRKCTYVLTPEEIQEEHAFIYSLFQGLKIAIMVHADVQFGMTRLGASIQEAGSNEFRPFWDYEAAVNWLVDSK